MTVSNTRPNRLVLDVTGPASAVENAFKLHLYHYQDVAGHVFHAPDTDPTIPASLADRLSGVVGLNDAPIAHPDVSVPSADALKELLPLSDFSSYTSPGGYYLTPQGIKTAYNLTQIPTYLNGQGQTLGLFEVDGYLPGDIQAYEQTYFPNLSPVYLSNIYVDTNVFSGQPETSSWTEPNFPYQ
jgi:subtilase family serine protease